MYINLFVISDLSPLSMHSPQKILYVFNEPAFFLSHRLPVAHAVLTAGYEVHVAAPNLNGAEIIISQGFVFHPISLKRNALNVFNELRIVRELHKLYTKLRPDLVELATIKPVMYGGLSARLARVPKVTYWMTGLGYVFIRQGLKAAVVKAGVELAYRFSFGHKRCRTIFENPDDQAVFIKRNLVPQKNTTVIRGAGVDLKQFLPLPEPSGIPLVILASRMLWDKGIGEFVDASRILKKDGVKARFVLVGDSDPGNLAAVPVEQLELWHNEKIIEWWGHQKNMPDVFASANIVCLPSYREGLPKVLIEAAACGRTIVTTDAPGCREIVKHNENGLLVPVRDSEALAAALKRLIENPTLRLRMGKRGREIAVVEFSVEKVVDETLAVYKDLLK